MPEAEFPSNTYDLYTIAFGIRNCTSVPDVLKEAYRVLKPGGTFACLEFSNVTNPLFRTYVFSHQLPLSTDVSHHRRHPAHTPSLLSFPPLEYTTSTPSR